MNKIKIGPLLHGTCTGLLFSAGFFVPTSLAIVYIVIAVCMTINFLHNVRKI